jgi:3-hydroxybutyryl-CoA dehydrogenase
MPAKSDDVVMGVVGAGLMGRGIAQIAAQAGVPVLLFDSRPGGAEEARVTLAATLATLASKGKITADAASAASGRLKVANTIEDLKPCTVVVEAIFENLEAKQQLLRALEGVVSADCVLATNTSSLSVTSIASAVSTPGRVAGFHFFSPVPLMKVVEVIPGPLTDERVVEALTALAARMGHAPVRASDTPGFIINHAGRGYNTEALRILGETIAPHAEIDRVLRQAAGFRMGPFELMDMTGLDVSQPVMESIYNQYYQEPRFRPSPIARQRLTAGLLGRKSQRGFYEYKNGEKVDAPVQAVPPRVERPVWLSVTDRTSFPEVAKVLSSLSATVETGKVASPGAICLVLPVGVDATTAAMVAGCDPVRTIALDPLFLSGRRTLMTTPATSPEVRDAAHALFASDATPVSLIKDSAGFIAQRVVATIVNIASDIAQQGVARPPDIDTAVKLGLGYPSGPLAMGDKLGAARVLEILDGLFEIYRDPRYRPSPWLRRRAQLGLSLLKSED